MDFKLVEKLEHLLSGCFVFLGFICILVMIILVFVAFIYYDEYKRKERKRIKEEVRKELLDEKQRS